jgi:hypothetical protein
MFLSDYETIIQEIRLLRDEIRCLKGEIRIMGSQTNAGLAALLQADSDLTAAVTASTSGDAAAIAEIQTLLGQLTGNEDQQVSGAATQIETLVSTLNANNAALTAAVAAATVPPAASAASAASANVEKK